MIYNSQIDKILKKILDENYVLQSSNAQNRLLNKYKINKKSKDRGIGNTWHTDSKYLAGKRIGKGFSYLVIVALDEFNKSKMAKDMKDAFPDAKLTDIKEEGE